MLCIWLHVYICNGSEATGEISVQVKGMLHLNADQASFECCDYPLLHLDDVSPCLELLDQRRVAMRTCLNRKHMTNPIRA